MKTHTPKRYLIVTITLFALVSLLTACGGNTPAPINALFEGDQYSQAGEVAESVVEEKTCTQTTDPIQILSTKTQTVMGCPETRNELGKKSLKYIKGLDCDLIVALSPDDITHMPFYNEVVTKLIPADDTNSQDIMSVLESIQEISACVDVNSWLVIQQIIGSISGQDPDYDNIWDNADMQIVIAATEGTSFINVLKEIQDIPDEWKDVLENDEYINGTSFIELNDNFFMSLGHERIILGVREKTLLNTFSDLPSVLDDTERMRDWNISKTSTVRALIGASIKKIAFDLLKDPDPEADDSTPPSATKVSEQVEMLRETIRDFMGSMEIEATEIPESAAILIGLTANQDFLCTEISGMVNNERIALNLNYLNSGRLRDYGLKLEVLIEKMGLLTMLNETLNLDEAPPPTAPADIDLSDYNDHVQTVPSEEIDPATIEHEVDFDSLNHITPSENIQDAGDLPNTRAEAANLEGESEADTQTEEEDVKEIEKLNSGIRTDTIPENLVQGNVTAPQVLKLLN